MRGIETAFLGLETMLGKAIASRMNVAAFAHAHEAQRRSRDLLVDASVGRAPAPIAWLPWRGWSPPPERIAERAAPLCLLRACRAEADVAQIEKLARRWPLWFAETVRSRLDAQRPQLRCVWLPQEDSTALAIIRQAAADVGALVVVGDASATLSPSSAADVAAPPLPVAREAQGARLLAPLLADHPPEARLDLGSVASHGPAATTTHLAEALGFGPVYFAPDAVQSVSSHAFYKWGIRQSRERAALDWYAARLGRPMLVLEDGVLLRSVGIGQGASRARALSVTLDPCTAYYDASRPSRVERRLVSGLRLSDAQTNRARACIQEIRRKRLSKYNNGLDTRRSYGPSTRKKILLVDQHRRDASVRYGLASEQSFDAMLRFAVRERPQHTLLLKRHPDSTQAGSKHYFTPRRLARHGLPGTRGILIDDQVNPHTLLDQVDEVFVVTSGLGFEALLAGIDVHCFGMPFYAGWGLTTDHIQPVRPRPPRSVEDLFHLIAIESAQYVEPSQYDLIDIESAIERFAAITPIGGPP